MTLHPWFSGFQQAPPLGQRWWGPATGLRRGPGRGEGGLSLLTHWSPSSAVLRGPKGQPGLGLGGKCDAMLPNT